MRNPSLIISLPIALAKNLTLQFRSVDAPTFEVTYQGSATGLSGEFKNSFALRRLFGGPRLVGGRSFGLALPLSTSNTKSKFSAPDDLADARTMRTAPTCLEATRKLYLASAPVGRSVGCGMTICDVFSPAPAEVPRGESSNSITKFSKFCDETFRSVPLNKARDPCSVGSFS